MKSEAIQEKWTEIKGKIEEKWGKFSQSELESIKGDLDEVVTAIQRAYGYAKDRAEREYHEFRLSLRPVLQPITKAPVPRR